jgi:hypothetical protein
MQNLVATLIVRGWHFARRQKTWVSNNFRVVVVGAAGTAAATLTIVLLSGGGTSEGRRGEGNPVVASLSCPASQQLITLTAGQADNFHAGAKPDVPPAAPSNGLQVRASPLHDFDDTAPNHRFGHTFIGLTPVITAAELVVSLKALEDGYGGGNDTLELGFTDPGGTLLPSRWARFIGTDSSNPSAGLLPSHWGPTMWPAGNTFAFDLAALPNASGLPTNLLAQLDANGFVDFYVQDDTSVDYLTLSLCVRRVAPTPTPTQTPSVPPTPVLGTPTPVLTIPAATVVPLTPTPTCGPAGTASACTPTPTATPRLTNTPAPTSTIVSTRIPLTN